MSRSRNTALNYARENHARFLDELKELVRIPSVSTDPQAQEYMKAAATWVADQLHALGMSHVSIFSTPGHPVVCGEYRCPLSDAKTLLVYGHYDVQPVDPLELWQSPPFEPTVQGDYLFGRGASDMKGQLLVGLKAIESILKTDQLNVHLRFLFEGEEEMGSPNLADFITQNQDRIRSDVALNLDSGILAPDFPSITISLRGLAYFELRVYGPASDLHSGTFGGVVHNPAQVLCELIAGMHDAQGRVTLPGFYDRVRPLDRVEREELARLPLNEDYFLKVTGAPALFGEEGYLPVERIGARPTLEVNGLYSGFIGEGSKTVLPAYAMAKISCRLVPDQDPREVHQQLWDYLEAHAPRTVRWELIQHAASPAAMIEPDRVEVAALSRAMEQVWGVKPAFKREGGSIPVVAQLKSILGMPTILTGFGLPDDNLHAPNERLHLPTWQRGIETLIHFFYNLEE
ncbi:MAG: dipeptidase [Anaerolineales bacterium]|nr:dipeptidase [Anaerolineales bacterium]